MNSGTHGTHGKTGKCTKPAEEKASIYEGLDELVHLVHTVHPEKIDNEKPPVNKQVDGCSIYNNIYINNASKAGQKANPNINPKTGVPTVPSVPKPQTSSIYEGLEKKDLVHNSKKTSVPGVPEQIKADLEQIMKPFEEAGFPLEIEEITYIGFPEQMAETVYALLISRGIMTFLSLASYFEDRGKGKEELRAKDRYKSLLFPWFSHELKEALIILHSEKKVSFRQVRARVYLNENRAVYERLLKIKNWLPAAVVVDKLEGIKK